MPRPAKIWLRKQTGWYCVTHRGVVTKLAKNKKEAERLFHELMAKPEEPAPVFGPSFKKLADEFLIHTQHQKSEEVFAQQTKAIQDFCNHVKGKRAAELKGHMVLAWLDAHKTWNDSTRTWAKKVIKAVCNWGVKQGYLEDHPLKKLPSGSTRRRDRVLTPDEMKRILEFVSPAFADFLVVVGETGARPYSEIARLEAKHIDLAGSTATLAEHKNAKKTGKPRVIYFPDSSLTIVRRLMAEYPVGPLFRTARHSRWSRVSAWKWFHEIETKLGIKAHCYALRTTRITEALINGVSVEVMAELAGNTPAVLHRHYAHVATNRAALLAAAKKAVSTSGT
jgi:integrase